jgi:hypothetical protein
MKILSILFVLVSINELALAGNLPDMPDTINPTRTIIEEKLAKPVDSNILIVVNGKKTGTLLEIKKDIYNIFSPEIIETINIYKNSEAQKKYGESGKNGAIEFILKKSQLSGEDVKRIFIPKGQVNSEIKVDTSNFAATQWWRNHLQRWVNSEAPAENFAPTGLYTAVVQFLVSTDGIVSDIRPLTNTGYGTEEEIIRALLRSPVWEPSYVNGKAVKVYRKQPVTFFVSPARNNSVQPVIKLSTYTLRAGEDNLVEIDVEGISDKDIEAELSEGSIIRLSIARYKARVEKQGKVILTISKYNKKKKKEEIGRITLNVQ